MAEKNHDKGKNQKSTKKEKDETKEKITEPVGEENKPAKKIISHEARLKASALHRITKFAKLSKKLKEELMVGPQPSQDIKRVPTGIEGLDDIIEGGFVERSIVLLSGGAGTAKTIMCLQYLYEGIVKYNEGGVFISFNEGKEAIYQHGKLFGWDFKKLEDEGKFGFIKYEPHEVHQILHEGGGTIKDLMDSIEAKRLAIDSLTSYTLMFEDLYKRNESVLELFSLLRKWGLTTLLVSESSTSTFEQVQERDVFLADGVIYSYYIRKELNRARALEVIKMRDTKHLEKICPFLITPRGVVVFPDAEVFE